MQTSIQIFLIIHIIAGSLSLVLFWIPAFTRKGNNLHRLTGKWYTYMMWIVVISAIVLSISNFIVGKINTALLLSFISIITAHPLWYGVTILRNKKSLSKKYLIIYRTIAMLMILLGVAILYYGVFHVGSGFRYLMIFFGILGLINIPQLLNSYRIQAGDTQWFRKHYSGMIISGIAAYTAFFAFGGRAFLSNILTNELQLIPWIAPTVIGAVAIRVLDKKYSRKTQPKHT